jgi:hypothetical protein
MYNMMVATKCATILIALATITSQALAVVSPLDCSTTKVVMTDGKSSRAQQEIHFYVDDFAKTIAFADGTRLRVIRFDKVAISAEHDDMRYELNRVDNSLTYAGSKTVGSVTVITVGSGQCRIAADKSGD